MTQHRPTSRDYLPAAGRDAFLPFYDAFTALLGAAKVHGALIDQAELAAGHRVLEIGCGTGNVTVRTKRIHPDVELVGSDPDPLALARARRKARNLNGIRFEQGYGQQLPYADGSFDRVLSALMFHHLDHDTKVATAAEVARVLRPGGRLHLVDFVGHAHGIHGFLAQRMVKAAHLDDDLAQLLGAAGLDCERTATRRHPVLGDIAYYRAVRPMDR
ncbi:class I SAM-dependent methyltransferase [Kutzneria sp. NPDC051319]|uniref:class I SAM-dependent methyltransferase n=1 Tax=Kutzneria sp. NPDC051319 TaxID=3155047 RepID=UPI00343BFED7